MIEDSTHDKLVKAYLNYFKWNEKFETKPSEIKKIETRKCLSEIRRLALERRQEVIDRHEEHKANRGKNQKGKSKT